MSNVHAHWHQHRPAKLHRDFDETHDGGWHAHVHIHTRRVPDEVFSNDEHIGSKHEHDHISSEGKFVLEPTS